MCWSLFYLGTRQCQARSEVTVNGIVLRQNPGRHVFGVTEHVLRFAPTRAARDYQPHVRHECARTGAGGRMCLRGRSRDGRNWSAGAATLRCGDWEIAARNQRHDAARLSPTPGGSWSRDNGGRSAPGYAWRWRETSGLVPPLLSGGFDVTRCDPTSTRTFPALRGTPQQPPACTALSKIRSSTADPACGPRLTLGKPQRSSDGRWTGFCRSTGASRRHPLTLIPREDYRYLTIELRTFP